MGIMATHLKEAPLTSTTPHTPHQRFVFQCPAGGSQTGKPKPKEIIMKKSLIALALLAAAASASALDIGVGVAGATGSSTSAGGAVAGGQQGSILAGVSGGQQAAASQGISGNITTVNSQGGTTISEHQDAAGATQVGGSLGFAAQTGASVGGSQSSATGSFGLLKGFVFANP